MTTRPEHLQPQPPKWGIAILFILMVLMAYLGCACNSAIKRCEEQTATIVGTFKTKPTIRYRVPRYYLVLQRGADTFVVRTDSLSVNIKRGIDTTIVVCPQQAP